MSSRRSLSPIRYILKEAFPLHLRTVPLFAGLTALVGLSGCGVSSPQPSGPSRAALPSSTLHEGTEHQKLPTLVLEPGAGVTPWVSLINQARTGLTSTPTSSTIRPFWRHCGKRGCAGCPFMSSWLRIPMTMAQRFPKNVKPWQPFPT